MKRTLKIFLCLAVMCTAVMAFPLTSGAASEEDPYGGDGFYITGYNVNAVISENNVYDITETLNVHFTEKKHGIIREIPLNPVETRENQDGSYTETRVSSNIWDVNVKGYDFSTEDDYETFGIKIGDADKLITGDQTYVISYKMGFGNDGCNDWDEVYYNIIGTGWDCTIDNVSFSVTLPKTFDQTDLKDTLGFSTGSEGSTGYNPQTFTANIEGNTITGKLDQRLEAYQGLTMRLLLPQGYFNVPDLRLPDWIAMGAMGLFLLIGFLLFLIFGRDKRTVQTVEFYAPDGLTPAETGYIIDGSVDSRDIVSMILYWAAGGYLSITDKGDKVYELKKLKDMNYDSTSFESNMFNGLFMFRESVTTDDLKYAFSYTYTTTKTMIQKSFEKSDRRVFTKSSVKLMPWMIVLTLIPFILSLTVSILDYGVGMAGAIVIGVMVGSSMIFPNIVLTIFLRRIRGETNKAGRLIWRLILWLAFAAGCFLLTCSNVYEPLMPWTALVSTLILGAFAVFIRKRTALGTEWMGKILGLKKFITVAEKDRINALVKDNPSYFYDILPYAYVLGVTDKWVKNFESITVSPPGWYYGSDMFTPLMFMHSMHTAMDTMRSHMSAGTSSSGGFSSGSGSSGGSFSGGGGGGGGGSSW